MRDMQSRYSHYLNVKYRDQPWLLIAPLYGVKGIDHFAPYLRTGPTNWTPRFDARFLDAKGFREFLRYLENNRAPRRVATQRVRDPHQEVVGYAWEASERLSPVTGLVEAS